MNFEIVRLSAHSGEKCTIYSVVLDDDDSTEFDHFIEENENAYPSEVLDISRRLHAMGHLVGARLDYFKDHEGKPGDGVCALYDNPESRLRLYCIRYGMCAIILGSGGPKSKAIRAFQEDNKLENTNDLMREVSTRIMKALKEKDLKWSKDGMELLGDLKFNEYE